MLSKTHIWKETNLGREISIESYGHYGFAILMFPAFTDGREEYKKEGLLDAVKPYIEKGKCKVYVVDTANMDSWLHEKIAPEAKSEAHLHYNNFIVEEVVPYIFGDCGGAVPVLTCGASLGAYHAANTYFRRPDIFYGVIAMSGTYNIEYFTKGYFDDNCYFNSPIHYLPNLHDEYWLSALRSKHHIYLLTGSGDGENPDNSTQLGNILASKDIPHMVDIWGPEWGHNYNTWKLMLANIIETKL